MRFFLGVHRAHWLGTLDVPLFLSARLLRERVGLPRALAPWSLDSGGFSELQIYGAWKTSAEQYAAEALRWRAEIGRLEWAAVQDYMCEPFMVKKTGLSVRKHQELTVESYTKLRRLAPLVPWAPVLQGWELPDYLRHLEMYAQAGVDLRHAPVVGVGSVCRRQHTEAAAAIFTRLAATGLPLHGFGLKVKGLLRVAPLLASSDSMAWSFNARKNPPLPGHDHMNCANCWEFALRWRKNVLRKVEAEHGSNLGTYRLLA